MEHDNETTRDMVLSARRTVASVYRTKLREAGVQCEEANSDYAESEGPDGGRTFMRASFGFDVNGGSMAVSYYREKIFGTDNSFTVCRVFPGGDVVCRQEHTPSKGGFWEIEEILCASLEMVYIEKVIARAKKLNASKQYGLFHPDREKVYGKPSTIDDTAGKVAENTDGGKS